MIDDAIEKANDPEARRDITHLAMQFISDLINKDEPQTFSDAWDHPNENDRMKWQDAIKKNS